MTKESTPQVDRGDAPERIQDRRRVLCVVRSGHHFNFLSTGAVDTGRHMNQCIHSPLGEISALSKFMLLSPEQISAHHLHMKDARLSRQRRCRGSKRGSKMHREWQQS
jgi:hypothetical protein